jgi:hypothetical protein
MQGRQLNAATKIGKTVSPRSLLIQSCAGRAIPIRISRGLNDRHRIEDRFNRDRTNAGRGERSFEPLPDMLNSYYLRRACCKRRCEIARKARLASRPRENAPPRCGARLRMTSSGSGAAAAARFYQQTGSIRVSPDCSGSARTSLPFWTSRCTCAAAGTS